MFSIIYNTGQVEHPSLKSLYKHDKIEKIEKSKPSNSSVDRYITHSLDHEGEKRLPEKNNLIERLYGKKSTKSHFSLPHTKIHTIMSHPVHSLYKSRTIRDALTFTKKYDCRHIPITSDNNILIGIVSDRDLLVHSQSNLERPISTIMKDHVLTARLDAEIRFAAVIMEKRHIGSLPVTSKEGELQGIVTRSDILKTFVDQIPIELIV